MVSEPVVGPVSVTVDARNLSCPMPIVRTAQRIRTVPSGELVEVLATDPGSVKDFAAWTRATGNTLVAQSLVDGVHHFVIRRA
jgi:tRNA 2-thiouridine synthesizing protein A